VARQPARVEEPSLQAAVHHGCEESALSRTGGGVNQRGSRDFKAMDILP
jgi:hypothetical protein